MLNAFTEANLAIVRAKINSALARIEDYADGGRENDVGSAFADLLAARGCLEAALQLEELVETISRAPTEPPPALRIVK